jgi:hypothetical protein
MLLHASLRRLLSTDPGLLVLAGHVSRPVAFDGCLIAGRLGEIGERLQLLAEAEAFADWVLQRVPPAPPNHHTIVALNEAGILPEGDSTDLEAGANRCAVG